MHTQLSRFSELISSHALPAAMHADVDTVLLVRTSDKSTRLLIQATEHSTSAADATSMKACLSLYACTSSKLCSQITSRFWLLCSHYCTNES
jgi:hypothetical protein